jgi:hypothetical protein
MERRAAPHRFLHALRRAREGFARCAARRSIAASCCGPGPRFSSMPILADHCWHRPSAKSSQPLVVAAGGPPGAARVRGLRLPRARAPHQPGNRAFPDHRPREMKAASPAATPSARSTSQNAFRKAPLASGVGIYARTIAAEFCPSRVGWAKAQTARKGLTSYKALRRAHHHMHECGNGGHGAQVRASCPPYGFNDGASRAASTSLGGARRACRRPSSPGLSRRSRSMKLRA